MFFSIEIEEEGNEKRRDASPEAVVLQQSSVLLSEELHRTMAGTYGSDWVVGLDE